MIYRIDTLNVNSDVLSYIANGDLTSLSIVDGGDKIEETIIRRCAEYTADDFHPRDLIPDDISDWGTDDNFSHRGCDIMRDGLGNNVYPVGVYVSAIGHTSKAWMGNLGVPYLNKYFIVDAMRDNKYEGVDFYGKSKAPTAIKVRCADNRTRRVWAIAKGNAGSAYIIVDGEKLFIDGETGDRITELAKYGDSAWLRNGGQSPVV